MNVLFLTHSFPRSEGDAAGSFILRLAVALRGEDVNVHVVAPAAAGRPASEEIEGVRVDRFRYAPRRYESAVDTVSIAKLGQAEGEVAIEGRIVSARSRPLPGRRTLVTAIVRDDAGQISASFFNQPWLLEKLTPGTPLRLRGRLGKFGFDVKSYDLGEARRTADHAPVYPASEQIPSTRLRTSSPLFPPRLSPFSSS